MRKYFIILLIFVLSIFSIGCQKNTKYSKEDVLKIIEKKGIDNVTWKDFENIEHEDVGFGGIVNVYKLDNDVEMILSGNGSDKPFRIEIIENGETTILKQN